MRGIEKTQILRWKKNAIKHRKTSVKFIHQTANVTRHAYQLGSVALIQHQLPYTNLSKTVEKRIFFDRRMTIFYSY